MRGSVGREIATRKFVFLIAPMVFGCNVRAQTTQVTPVRPTPDKGVFHVKQIPLTERQIQGAIAAAAGVKETTEIAKEGINELRSDTVAKLDAVAKARGLASYEEFQLVWKSFIGGNRFR